MFIFRKYITNVSSLQLLQLARFATVLMVSVVMAKTYMPVVEIGHYERLLFYGSALTFFWATGLIQSLLPLFGNNLTFNSKTDPKNPAFFNAAFLLSLLGLAASLIVLAFSLFIKNNSSQPLIYWLMAYVALSGPVLLIEYIYLLHDKPLLILRYGAISLSLQFILIATPALMHKPVSWCFGGLILSLLFRWVWLIILLLKVSRFKVSMPFIKEHFHLGYPLIISALLSGSAQYIDGLLVNWFYDPATFAIFRYGARELPLSVLLANAFDNSMTPEFNRHSLSENLLAIQRKSEKLMHIIFPVSIILLATSNWLYPLVFNEHFISSASVFNIYLLLAISRMVFPQTILVGHKLTRYVMAASLAEMGIHISVCFLFIHLWGINGVAFSTLFSYMAEKALLALFVYQKLGIHPTKYMAIKTLLIYSSIAVLVYLFVNSLAV